MSPGEFGNLDSRIRYSVRGAPRQNFGDYLPELFGRELLYPPAVSADAFRLVGSVVTADWLMRDLRRSNGFHNGVVAYWGCGARDDRPLPDRLQRHAVFFAVRGPLTRDVLRLPKDTPIGDSGLLVPICHPVETPPEGSGELICIPHFEDPRRHDDLLSMSGCDRLLSPVVTADEPGLRGLLDRIASARFVLSASLHGAIIAFAYQRPFAFWDNGHLDVPFKWADFAASIGVEARFLPNATQGMTWYREAARTMVRPRLLPLLLSCPCPPRADAVLAAAIADGEVLAEEPVQQARQRLQALIRVSSYRLETLATECRSKHGPLKPAPTDAIWRDIGLTKEAAKRRLRRLLNI